MPFLRLFDHFFGVEAKSSVAHALVRERLRYSSWMQEAAYFAGDAPPEPGPPRLKAAFTSAIWERAWGKFPTRRLAPGSYSSDSKPTSLASDNTRSKSFLASSSRPCNWRARTIQKLQARKTPSPGGSPSEDVAVLYRRTKPPDINCCSIAFRVPLTRGSAAGRKP